MVRRGRSASPKSSGSVRSATTASRSAVPATTPARPAGTQQPTGAAAPASQQQGPGLFGQMAATAGGVAIGSAMGHALGNMFSGDGGKEAAPQQETPANSSGFEKQQPQRYSQPCEFEWRQFLECSQNQPDVAVCQSFNDVFKECKTRYAN